MIRGPHGDSALTSRKIIVDTYGGIGRHGGGAFSGKDPSKVDRSAAHMARYVAKIVVAAELADRCEVELAEDKIEKAIREVFDLTPAGIIKTLDLKRPMYQV